MVETTFQIFKIAKKVYQKKDKKMERNPNEPNPQPTTPPPPYVQHLVQVTYNTLQNQNNQQRITLTHITSAVVVAQPRKPIFTVIHAEAFIENAQSQPTSSNIELILPFNIHEKIVI